jgi:hypothetical protein
MKKLNRSTLLSLAALLLLAAAPSAWAAERMKSGQWEMTTMDGSRSRTATHCVTPEELKAANGTPAELRAYIEQGTKAANCTVQNFKVQGDTVSYTSACKGTSTDSTTTSRRLFRNDDGLQERRQIDDPAGESAAARRLPVGGGRPLRCQKAILQSKKP